MRNRLGWAAAACALAVSGAAGVASAQAPAASRASGPGAGPLAIPNPNYVTIVMETDVERPAAEVWARIGGYCGIGEWAQMACTILSGNDGEVGAVRSVANEILVAKTEFSYTYTQPVREGQPYNLYHGTIEARPVTPTSSKLVYTLFYDNSMLADDAAREADKQRRTTLFTRLLGNMKTLAEGGTLPPREPRGN